MRAGCAFIAVGLVLSSLQNAQAQPRGGAGGLGAASGRMGGPGIGVSAGGVPGVADSFANARGFGTGWPALTEPQSANPNASTSYLNLPEPLRGGLHDHAVQRRESRTNALGMPDVRGRQVLSNRDDLYLNLSRSILGNPHEESRRPRKKVGTATVGGKLGGGAGIRHHRGYFSAGDDSGRDRNTSASGLTTRRHLEHSEPAGPRGNSILALRKK